MPVSSARLRAIYIGIDPGQKGGLVALYPSLAPTLSKMPDTELGVCRWFRSIRLTEEEFGSRSLACLEYVRSMPGQGVASMFKFGWGYGGLRMALIANEIPFEEVTPRKWQAAFSIQPREKKEGKPQFKKRLRARAEELFPDLEVTNETADALLIAEYCRRKHEGRL